MATAKELLEQTSDLGNAVHLIGLAVMGVAGAMSYVNRKYVSVEDYAPQPRRSDSTGHGDRPHLKSTGTDS